jgi:hypothetical protein
MLLKEGHRHVYMSRQFALEHGFVPTDAAPGRYGYGGLVNIGSWGITLKTVPDDGEGDHSRNPYMPSGSRPATPSVSPKKTKGKDKDKGGAKMIPVYLSEEPHFDVVLGRSFFEKRQIHINPLDPTDVWCGDEGEKLLVELVVLRDANGDIVSVT